MGEATILLIALSHGGHWLAGHEHTAQIRWNVDAEERPAARMRWRLSHGPTVLKEGRVAVPPAGARLRIELPEVRTRTTLRLSYTLLVGETRARLDEGSRLIQLYPDRLLADTARQLSGQRVIVWDRAGGFSRSLEAERIGHVRVDGPAGLRFRRPRLILVAPGQLRGVPGEQQALLGHARSGASLVVFHQQGVEQLLGYSLRRRRPSDEPLVWDQAHPLAAALQPFAPGRSRDGLRTLRLPPKEASLAIGRWPRNRRSAVDAVALEKSVGTGRVICCQVPMGAWPDDARSQLFLAAVVDRAVSPLPSNQRSARFPRRKPDPAPGRTPVNADRRP